MSVAKQGWLRKSFDLACGVHSDCRRISVDIYFSARAMAGGGKDGRVGRVKTLLQTEQHQIAQTVAFS
jgi:hypothetical protein